jgi:4-amino-4-deoxy-L-arabinose transferase-like glycosyltransferase
LLHHSCRTRRLVITTPESKAQGGGSRLAMLLLAVSAVFWAVGFVHLRADFPNGSPWMDWSKMTDEGWYGGGAIQHFVFGRWFLPESFNPAVAMPVWPVMLGGWFAVTGMSMIAARTLTMLLYGAALALLYVVVRRAAGSVAASLAVLVTAVNPLCYAFDRMALLEPLTVFWMMLGLWLADGAQREDSRRMALLRPVLLGIVLCVLVWTKPTNVALAPGILYMLWASAAPGRPVRAQVWPVALAAVVAAGLWLAYFLGVVQPHYLADYKLLFSANDYRVHLSIVPQMAWVTLRDGLWIQPVLYPAAVAMVLASAIWLRGLWRKPVFGAAVIASVCHLAYIGYHTNFQPRYYLVMAMPMAIAIALGLEEVWRRCGGWAKAVLAVGLAATVVWMALWTGRYGLHPEYSFLTAAQSIASIVRADAGGPQLLLSDSGADIMLFTGVPAIDEGHTTDGLDALLQRYHPGWYAAWPGWESPAIAQVGRRYRLDEVARYRVFDDPKRQVLVLYKLSPR